MKILLGVEILFNALAAIVLVSAANAQVESSPKGTGPNVSDGSYIYWGVSVIRVRQVIDDNNAIMAWETSTLICFAPVGSVLLIVC